MFSVFFEERCSLALRFIYWLADNTLPWNLKNSLKFSQSQFTNWVLRNALVLLCIATPCRAKVSKSQIQKKKNAIDFSFIMLLSLLGTQRHSFFGNTCLFWLHFWSWQCLSALLMLALPSGAWRQRAQKKWSETAENATSFLYLVQQHHHICTYFIFSKIFPCLCKQKRRHSLLCCKQYINAKASGVDVVNLEICQPTPWE